MPLRATHNPVCAGGSDHARIGGSTAFQLFVEEAQQARRAASRCRTNGRARASGRAVIAAFAWTAAVGAVVIVLGMAAAGPAPDETAAQLEAGQG